MDKQPLYNMQGESITAVQFIQQIKTVWEFLPMTNHVLVEPITIQAEAEEGTVTAVIRWHNDDKEIIGQAESHFR